MTLSKETSEKIEDLLKTVVREKLRTYQPETTHMPFHHRLLGKDRYAMFSFIQSMNTTFGMSIWEQVAVILAKNAGKYAIRQYKLLGEIDDETQKVIDSILHKLRIGEIVPNKKEEIETIRKKIKKGSLKEYPDCVVDLFLKTEHEEHYFDITSAKPNMKEFVALKLKLLKWTALRLCQDSEANVFTRLAIPYNPYHPEPYERWTLKGLYDLNSGEILIGEEFWNFVAGEEIYEELLNIFHKVGEELRDEIDETFAKFRKME